MAKFIIKESSITGNMNSRILQLIKDELSKHIDGLEFIGAMQTGNHAFCESKSFTEEQYRLMSPDNLKKWINETLNFRYENFTITIA
jgi:hypothetical protein